MTSTGGASRERRLKGYGRTTVSFEENGKFYVQQDIHEPMSGKADYTATYVELDKREYTKRLALLAKRLASNPAVKIEDVIYDALKDYPLSFIERFERATEKETAKPEPSIRTKKGFCCELVIGDDLSFVLRH